MGTRILLIEDEPAISMAVRDELEFEGFEVLHADNGISGLDQILNCGPDLVILDLMLPEKNGFEICREARALGIDVPIIMLTARTQEADRVRGLDLGADDYVIKPFSLAELCARVRAVLRRGEKDHTAGREGPDTLQAGSLRLDMKKHEVFLGKAPVGLTPKEFALLALLMRRTGEAITRDSILDDVWGEEVYVTHRTVDSHVATLRRKIEVDPDNPRYILTVRGVGYKLNENPNES